MKTLEILARRLLAGEIGQDLRAERRVVLGTLFGRDETARRVGHVRRPRPVEEPPARRPHGQAEQVRRHGADKAGDRAASNEGTDEPHFDSIKQSWVDPFGGP